MSREEILTQLINYKRAKKLDKCTFVNMVPAYRIGKAVFYIHCGEFDKEADHRQIKYSLIRPDLNYCETGTFDYVCGWDLRDYLTDIYFSKNFDDF